MVRTQEVELLTDTSILAATRTIEAVSYEYAHYLPPISSPHPLGGQDQLERVNDSNTINIIYHQQGPTQWAIRMRPCWSRRVADDRTAGYLIWEAGTHSFAQPIVAGYGVSCRGGSGGRSAPTIREANNASGS